MTLPPELRQPAFWTARIDNGEAILMTPDEIDRFNREVVEGAPSVVSLDALPPELDRATLTERILARSARPGEPHYDHADRELHESFWQAVEAELGLPRLPARAPLRRGMTVRRSLLRRYPSAAGIFKRPGEPDLDRNAETALGAGEPLAALAESDSGDWLFVQTYNYNGWLARRDLALADPASPLPLVERPGEFLTILGRQERLVHNPVHPGLSELPIDMGQALRLVPDEELPETIDGQAVEGNWPVHLPQRGGPDASLWMQPALLPASADACHGRPPYCRARVIEQAFKCRGERYGWGGMYNARDCASLIQDVFRCFGLRLPRNAGEQGRMRAGRFTPFPDDMPEAERRRILVEEVPPGAALYMEGHVVLYLGHHQGRPCVLQDLYEYFAPEPDGRLRRHSANQVLVSSLELLRADGRSFLAALYGARDFLL